MGDRGQVCIQFPNQTEKVYLYSHWGADNLVDIVQKALAKRWRWDDPGYLARIIFCEMVKGDENSETGFGIDTMKHFDIWRLITVDCQNQEIVVEDHGKVVQKQTFEGFIKQGGEENGKEL